MATVPADMTPEKLRLAAGWLDTYDALVLKFIDALSPRLSAGDELRIRNVVARTEVQDSLRRWADEIEQETSGQPV